MEYSKQRFHDLADKTTSIPEILASKWFNTFLAKMVTSAELAIAIMASLRPTKIRTTNSINSKHKVA